MEQLRKANLISNEVGCLTIILLLFVEINFDFLQIQLQTIEGVICKPFPPMLPRNVFRKMKLKVVNV